MLTATSYDRAATMLSLSCIAHCLALPVIAMSVPIVAVFAEAEWVHWVLALLAIAASGGVIATDRAGRASTFVVPVIIGLTLISGALFAEHFGMSETTPTVVGGLILAVAHIRRLINQS